MYQQCRSLGPARCLLVRYEALVLAPAATMRRVLAFLDLPWHDAVLHHERYINQPNGVALSKYDCACLPLLTPSYRIFHSFIQLLHSRTNSSGDCDIALLE